MKTTPVDELKKRIVSQLRCIPKQESPHEAPRLLISKDDTAVMRLASAFDIGERLVGRLVEHGIEEALPQLFGLHVTWDADLSEIRYGGDKSARF